MSQSYCGAGHPRLAPGNVCTEPVGHKGAHVATDGCGRPEYFWPQHRQSVDVHRWS